MIPIEQPAVGLDETRASEPETTSDEEFLVASLREKGEPEFSADRILVQESGAVGIALETAYPIAEGRGLVLRGWVSDPYDTVESIWLRIGERSQRVKLSRTYFRQDVIDHKKLADIRPGYRAGFDLIEKVKLPSAASARIALHAIFRQQTGRSVISSGKIVDLSKSASLERVLSELSPTTLSPNVLSRISYPVLKGAASIARRSAWQDARVEVVGDRVANVSIILVVNANVEMLEHIFGMLELSRALEKLELIVVVQQPSVENEALARIRRWRFGNRFASMKTIVPSEAVTFGAAVNRAVTSLKGEHVTVMSDEMLPPVSEWMRRASELLESRRAEIVLPRVTTFDYLSSDFGHLFKIDWSTFEFDHSKLEKEHFPKALTPYLSLPNGIVIATKLKLASNLFDPSYSFVDIAMLDFLIRASNNDTSKIAQIDHDFTHLRLREHYWSDERVRLMNLYAFVDCCCQTVASPVGSPDLATPELGPEQRIRLWNRRLPILADQDPRWKTESGVV